MLVYLVYIYIIQFKFIEYNITDDSRLWKYLET